LPQRGRFSTIHFHLTADSALSGLWESGVYWNFKRTLRLARLLNVMFCLFGVFFVVAMPNNPLQDPNKILV
jgi:hypothetical protein